MELSHLLGIVTNHRRGINSHLLDELAAGKGHSVTMEPVVFDLASVADQKIETLQALVNSLTQEKTSLEEKVRGHCCVVGWGLSVWFLL